MSLPVLGISFLVVAALYASVGFGGGSSYNALLALAGVDYAILPVIALACNIAVVAGSSVRYARAGLLKINRIAPIVLLSVPFAWAGGRLAVPEAIFIGLLGIALLISGVQLLFYRVRQDRERLPAAKNGAVIAAWTGAGIGFLSGIVGIGGGIFLAPLLYRLRWAPPKEIAATSSFFILVNSIAGIAGQTSKWSDPALMRAALEFWPLLPGVAIGGQLGVWFGVAKARDALVARMTGLLILYVAIRLLWRWLELYRGV